MSDAMNNQPEDAAPLRSHEAEAMDRWLDAGLDEALGGERAPDVTAQVIARAAAGERPLLGPEDVPVGAGLWRQLWLAALLLLGLGVVGGVAWMQRAGAGRDHPAQFVAAPSMQDPGDGELGEGEIVVVRSRQEVASLPTDLRAVKVELGKRGMEELVDRCPKLEILIVEGVHPDVRPRRKDQDDTATTAELMTLVGRLSELRDLRLGYLHDADASLAPLRQLAKLRSLALQFSFGIEQEGAEVVASLQGLETLRIDCMEEPIRPVLLRAIAELTALEHLELHSDYSPELRDSKLLAALKQLRELRIHLGAPFGPPGSSAVHDDVIQDWPALRRLWIPHAMVTEQIGARLVEKTPALIELDLGGCSLDVATVRGVLQLSQLQKLCIAGVRTSTGTNADSPADLVALLAAAKPLREVDLGVAPWFTLEHAATLLAAGKRVRVERDDAEFQLKLADLHRQHTYRQIRAVAEIATLPPMVTHVEVRNLGDRAAVALAACPWIEVLEFVRDDQDPLTAVGLDAVLVLPALRRLHVVGVDALPADALRSLAKGKKLRTLSLVGCVVGDAALAVLPSLPELRELYLIAVRGFGDAGMRGIAGCRHLTSLTLSACKHLTTEQLALVGELRTLNRLALANLPNLHDRAVMSLQHLLVLQDLDLTQGPFTSMALQAVAELPSLRHLVLAECTGLVSSALLHVPTGVRDLDLSGCGFDAAASALLRDRFPALRKLVLRDADWLDDEGFRALLAAPSLEHLAAKGCTKMTPVHADAIRAAKRLRFLEISRSTCVRDEDVPGLAADRPDLQIVRKVW
ncbi:MAG: hypothetical protein ACK501_00430 [Planctomycetota bacterium]